MTKEPIMTRDGLNTLLQYLADHVDIGAALPSEFIMAGIARWDRTTVRRALIFLAQRGIIDGAEHCLKRKPDSADYIDDAQARDGAESACDAFLAYLGHAGAKPGCILSETAFARAAGMNATTVRCFLARISRNGLLEKIPGGGWRLAIWDSDYVEELWLVRETFEIMAVRRIGQLDPADPLCVRGRALLASVEAFAAGSRSGLRGFPALGRELHRFLIGSLNNRFASRFIDDISIVLHQRYLEDEGDAQARIRTDLREQLNVLRALNQRETAAAAAAMQTHLRSTRRSVGGQAGRTPQLFAA